MTAVSVKRSIGPDFEIYLQTYLNCITAFCCCETVNANVTAGCSSDDLFFYH